MQLTKLERLILINQYEILKLLDKKHADYYQNKIEILLMGYLILYGDILSIMQEDEPIENGQFVFDILSVYRLIEGYKFHHPEDREVAGHEWGRFKGFDATDDCAYYSFTKFLIERYDRFEEQKKHLEAAEKEFKPIFGYKGKYARMIRMWKELDYDLSTRERVMAVLEA